MNVLEIGSSARGDKDRWSDRDVLVIGEATQLPSVEARLSAQGASVVSLTRRKFEYLASHGSLFLKHTIDEGRLLEGSSDAWLSMGRKWHFPVGNYSEEIESNLNFLHVLRCVPEQESGAVAAIDIMVCSLRNVLIRKLASRGIFKFSWNDVAKHSAKVVSLPTGAWAAVAWAREQKNKRRAGLPTQVTVAQVEECAELFGRVLGSGLIGWTSSNTRLERLASAFSDGSYAQLRAFELLCANGRNDVGLRSLRAVTSKPSYFCSGRSGLH